MSNEDIKQLIITADDIDQFKRLDQFLNSKLTKYSRNQIKNFFQDGYFKSTQKIELKKLPAIGTIIEFSLPKIKETNLEPQNIPLDIIFEDEHLIIINKPAGMVVHPAPGNWDQTLVNALLYHCKDLKGIGHEKRPGIVHRLDKGTTGIMVAAKSQDTHNGLIKLFSNHDIQREYEAIVIGVGIEQFKKISTSIGRSSNNRLKMQANVKNGKEAISYFNLKRSNGALHHINCRLETGRTHQIRVHCAQVLNHPILMDPLYGTPAQHLQRIDSEISAIIADYPHPLLHARLLGFEHPITKKKLLFEKEAPNPFRDVLDRLTEN